MRQQARTKEHIVKYKGWTLIQRPWKSFEGVQYAKYLFNEHGQERLHAGYSKYRSHKELRLYIRSCVNRVIPTITGDKK